MKARGNDSIWWVPADVDRAKVEEKYGAILLHPCPMAVVAVDATRESLDPMALGVCRYCSDPLPVEG